MENYEKPKNRVGPTERCNICREAVRLGDMKPHRQTVHPDYLAWQKRWLRGFLLVMGLAAAMLLYLLLVVFPCDQACQQGDPFSWGGFYVILGYVGLSSSMVGRLGLKLREFRKKWTEEHGGAIQP